MAFVGQPLAATAVPEENIPTPFFCYICGGPATSCGLLKHSTYLQADDQDEDDDFDEDRDLFMDYCSCEARDHPNREMHSESCDLLKGYDSQLVSRADTKWLEYMRMVTRHVPNAHLFGPDDSGDLNNLTPLGVVSSEDNFFFYRRIDGPRDFWPLEREKGFLIHDTCLDVLRTVYRDTVSHMGNLDLRDLLLFFKLHREERDDEDFDWGHGQAFGIEDRFEDFMSWNPVAGSEVCHNSLVELLKAGKLTTEKWIVMDPKAPCDFRSLLETVSRAPGDMLSFKLPSADSKESLQIDPFSSIPPELRIAVLEILPTASVLNLFLASSAFRVLGGALPQSFWKSRLFFDVPWCADMVLAQTTSLRNSHIRFDKFLYQLKEVSKSGTWALPKETGGAESASTKDSLRLKVRRHVWLNCERILEDIESRNAILPQQANSAWANLGNLTTRKVISISRLSETSEFTSDAYVVPDPFRETQLLGIIAHFAHDGHIVGVEFQLSQGTPRQLFGMRSGKVKAVAFDSNAPIIAVMVSFGSLRTHQDKSAMFGLGIVVEDRPSEPSYTIGAWNRRNVIQILCADPGMQVIGITGEFNTQTITTFGIITANKTFTPSRVRQAPFDYRLHARWAGSHLPLDWPLRRYEAPRPYGDSACMSRGWLDPPVFGPPIYCLDLTGRRVTTIKAFWTSHLPEQHSHDQVFKGFIFTFTDGSSEKVGETRTGMQAGFIQRRQGETFTALKLYFAFPRRDAVFYSAKLCGVSFTTNHKRELNLGHTESRLYGNKLSLRDRKGNGMKIRGLQFGLTPWGVANMGLLSWWP